MTSIGGTQTFGVDLSKDSRADFKKNVPVERLPKKRFSFDYMFQKGSLVEIKLGSRM